MLERDVHRRRIRRVCLVIAAAGATWSAWLLMGGSATLNLLGLAITSHSPVRPLLITSFALTVFLLAGGRVPLPSRAQVGRGARVVRSVALLVAGLKPPEWILAIGLALGVGLVGWYYGAKAVGGADSLGYASEAEGMISGGVRHVQPWVSQVPWPRALETFTPHGYAPLPDGSAIVPMYAPGLPLLMAAMKLVVGQCGIFVITPMSAAVLVLATFGLGRRLGSDAVGLVAAWLVATSPTVLFMLQTPMSDIPGAAAWAVVFYWATFVTPRAALMSGMAAGLAVLIRLNLAPMIAVPAVWYFVRAWRTDGQINTLRWRPLAAFGLGLLPFIAIILAFNARVNGHPFQLGYTRTAGWFTLAHVWPNVLSYSRWFIDTQTPVALAGVAALLLPVRWLWRHGRGGAVAGAAFAGMTLAMYCAYMEFGVWWFLRLLLPCWPFVMIGVGIVLVALARTRPVWLAAPLAALVVWVGVSGVQFSIRERIFDLGAGDAKFPATGRLVAALTEPRSVVLSSYHSGSLRYYGGRVTMDYVALDPAWVDRAVAWMGERGVHVYALLEADELDQFKQRFASTETVRRMHEPLAMTDPWSIYLYDLSDPGRRVPVHAVEHPGRFVCVPPVPRPAIDFALAVR